LIWVFFTSTKCTDFKLSLKRYEVWMTYGRYVISSLIFSKKISALIYWQKTTYKAKDIQLEYMVIGLGIFGLRPKNPFGGFFNFLIFNFVYMWFYFYLFYMDEMSSLQRKKNTCYHSQISFKGPKEFMNYSHHIWNLYFTILEQT